MSFIAQLDLSEVARYTQALPLPTSGALVFFYDCEQRAWGFDAEDKGCSLVSYVPGPATTLVRTSPPNRIPDTGIFSPCALTFQPDENLPDPWAPHFVPGLSEDERSLLVDFTEEHDEVYGEAQADPRHRLGGHADCVQNSMELECQLVTHGLYCGNSTGYENPAAKELQPGALDWRLLLQIDTDDAADMMWGDVGRIYYWIHNDDLAKRRFERSWLIFQCY